MRVGHLALPPFPDNVSVVIELHEWRETGVRRAVNDNGAVGVRVEHDTCWLFLPGTTQAGNTIGLVVGISPPVTKTTCWLVLLGSRVQV